MKISNHSAVPVYTISGSNTSRPLPEWLARKRKRSLKHDPEYANRIELLQDFEFEEASQCVQVSDDGEWVMSTGTYKPQIHTHYLPHLSLSFSRHTISLNTKFLLLSSDYTKSIHLQSDRSIEFHTPLGCHYTTRLPRYGRDLIFNRFSADTLIPAVGVNESGLGEVFRLNLESGRFMRPYEVDLGKDDDLVEPSGPLQGQIGSGAVNVAAVAEDSHGLLAFGTSIDTIEFWDPRSRHRIALLSNASGTDQLHDKQEVTALKFDRRGLGLAAGSSAGLVHLYDLRSPHPLLKKDQGYGFPIQDIIYLSSSNTAPNQTTEPKILTSDKRIIKIWNARDGTPWTSVEPAVDINSVAWCKDSGMLLTANEGRQQHSFFIPQLGPAPKWCSFLDNLVEEMSEDPTDPHAFESQKAGEIYDNYKFLTTQQLDTLNLSHLIGTTSLLRPYMHGYFVAQRLYEEAKLIADPYVWEDQRNKRVKEKIAAERESRIRGGKNVNAKVNKKLAEKIAERQDREEQYQSQRQVDRAESGRTDVVEKRPDAPSKPVDLLADPRFSKLFQDEDFAIDERSHEFQLLNPSTKPTTTEPRKLETERRLTAVEQEAIDDVPASDSDDDDVSSTNSVPTTQAPVHDRAAGRISTSSYRKSGHRPSEPQGRSVSLAAKPQIHSKVFKTQPTHALRRSDFNHQVNGEKEISFAPERKQKSGKPVERAERKSHKDRRSASGNVFRNM